MHRLVRRVQHGVRPRQQSGLAGCLPLPRRHHGLMSCHARHRHHRRPDASGETGGRHGRIHARRNFRSIDWPYCRRIYHTAAGWRWTFWVLAIMSGVMAIVILFFTQETYPYILLERKTKRLREETGNPNLRSALDTGRTPRDLFAFSIFRPLKMLLSPIVFSLSLYAAVVYSYLYLCFTTFEVVFGSQYGFSSGQSGVATLGLGIGAVLGIIGCAASSQKISAHLTEKNGGDARPEYRLPPMIVGAFVTPVGLFWYGWSAQAKTHWIVPILGTALIGVGMILTYVSIPLLLDYEASPNNFDSDAQRDVSGRRIHSSCSLSDGCEHNLAMSAWRTVTIGRTIHVQSAGTRMGQLAPWIYRYGLQPVTFHFLPIRSADP